MWKICLGWMCWFGLLGGSAQAQGMGTEQIAERVHVPVAILGGGVGALTSAIYLGRAGISATVVEGSNPGGLIAQSHAVQNWPGEIEINGAALAAKIRDQAKANGARFESGEVVQVDLSRRPFLITVQSLSSSGLKIIEADSVIIAMGTQPNFLGIPGEREFWGKGVTNCAVCDGALFRDQVVGVVGGGDAAVLEAEYLSQIAREVHVFVRKGSFKGVEEKRLQALLAASNVHVHFNTTVEEILGSGEGVSGVSIRSAAVQKQVPLQGIFLAIGSKPNSALFQGVLELEEGGYIALKKDQETSVQGVYAIGDIVDPVYKQAVSAAGDGAKAAIQAQKFLADRGAIVRAQSSALKAAAVAGEVIEITHIEQFRQELASANVPVVVDFYATWCGPCRRISPLIDQTAAEMQGRVKFLKVNVDLVGPLTSEYNIRSMPTVLLFDAQGALLERKVGSEQISRLLHDLGTRF